MRGRGTPGDPSRNIKSTHSKPRLEPCGRSWDPVSQRRKCYSPAQRWDPPSSKPTVSEQDFGPLLRERARGFLTICAVPSGARWSKRRFFEVSASADELESFLDDHGARTNRTFSAFTELVASIRGFALAGMQLAHLDRRLESYGVAGRLPRGGGCAPAHG